MSKTICVVLSSYNGERYIRDQIDSILQQELPSAYALSLIVRDDGSKDNTGQILDSYAEDARITILKANNIGLVASFLQLIENVPKHSTYIALADQDDVWHPDKLKHAIETLEKKDASLPQLYCSEYVYCDENMRPLEPSHHKRLQPTLSLMLYENIVSGNTIVMNDFLLKLVQRGGIKGVYCHDWWIALLAAAFGEITYDEKPSLDYRRTGSNASPTGSSGLKLLAYRFRTFIQGGDLERITGQLRKLLNEYGDDLSPENRRLLKHFLRDSSLSKAITPLRLRQTLGGEAMVRTLLLLGKL